MPWTVINELSGRAAVAWLALRDVVVRPSSEALQAALRARAAGLRDRYPDPRSAVPLFAPARALYHRLGMDPSKLRPSCEALVRRILQGKELYSVNTAVDAANLASILHLRPVGLYDSDRIEPWELPPAAAGSSTGAGSSGSGPSGGLPALAVRLRFGLPGEEYAGIRKETIHLEGRPGLFDRLGPFGNPSSDSDRTKVTVETRRLLFVLFEPPGETEVERHLELSRTILLRHVGGVIEGASGAEAGWAAPADS